MRDILYTLAYDSSDELVLATNAVKGEAYRCPGCNGAMIPRRSIEQKKGAKRPHYAHKVLSPNCKPESVLHFGFKRLLSSRIQKHLDNGEELPIAWVCDTCQRLHAGNLLKKAKRVVEEYPLGQCRPDIILLDADNKPVWAVEVIVSHFPEDQVLDYYREHRIALAEFYLESDTDLSMATASPLEPIRVEQCVNPRCTKCGYFKRNVVLWIIEGGCWKCGCVMPVAIVEGGESRGRTYAGPEQFTDHELAIARSKGCTIRSQYSHTQRRRYPANSCKECGAFVGEHYTFTEYVSPAGFGELECEKIDVGHYCSHCDTEAVLNSEWESVESDDVVEEVIDRAVRPKVEEMPEWKKPKEGFCIRCRTQIVRNKFKPLCSACYSPYRFAERENMAEYMKEQYCHRCGESGPTTRWKPFCLQCFFVAGGTRRKSGEPAS